MYLHLGTYIIHNIIIYTTKLDRYLHYITSVKIYDYRCILFRKLVIELIKLILKIEFKIINNMTSYSCLLNYLQHTFFSTNFNKFYYYL